MRRIRSHGKGREEERGAAPKVKFIREKRRARTKIRAAPRRPCNAKPPPLGAAQRCRNTASPDVILWRVYSQPCSARRIDAANASFRRRATNGAIFLQRILTELHGTFDARINHNCDARACSTRVSSHDSREKKKRILITNKQLIFRIVDSFSLSHSLTLFLSVTQPSPATDLGAAGKYRFVIFRGSLFAVQTPPISFPGFSSSPS